MTASFSTPAGLAAAAEVRIKLNSTKEPVLYVIAGHCPRAPYPTTKPIKDS